MSISQWIVSRMIDPEKEKRVDLLQRVPLFKGLSRTLLKRLLVDLFEKAYGADEVIFQEGEIGKAVYIVVEGTVRISRKHGSGESVLTRLGPGSYFGELALMGQSARVASATTESPTLLLILYKTYFDSLISGRSVVSSQVLMNLLESMSDYLKTARPVGKDEETAL